jgi:hypothetical protein
VASEIRNSGRSEGIVVVGLKARRLIEKSFGKRRDVVVGSMCAGPSHRAAFLSFESGSQKAEEQSQVSGLGNGNPAGKNFY